MKTLHAHVLVLSANLIYGANYSLAKKVMPAVIQPFGFVMIRVIAAAVLFFMVSAFVFEKEKIKREDWIRLALCGLFGVAVNQLLFFAGLSITTPVNAALMMTTNPVLVLLMAHLIIREPVTPVKVLGIMLALSGALLLILKNGTAAFSLQSAAGDIMVLINSLSFAVFLVLVKPLMMRFHPLTVMKWVFLFGSLPVVFFGTPELLHVRWLLIDFQQWLIILYVVLAVTFLAYLFNTLALRQLDASQVSIYIYLQPVFAALFSVLFGEGLPMWIHLISALLIFSGIYLTSKKTATSKT